MDHTRASLKASQRMRARSRSLRAAINIALTICTHARRPKSRRARVFQVS
jgi:hypothetical protein